MLIGWKFSKISIQCFGQWVLPAFNILSLQNYLLSFFQQSSFDNEFSRRQHDEDNLAGSGVVEIW